MILLNLLEAISKIIFGRFWYIVAVKNSDFVAIAPLCLLNLNFFRSTYLQNRLKAIFEIASSDPFYKLHSTIFK